MFDLIKKKRIRRTVIAQISCLLNSNQGNLQHWSRPRFTKTAKTEMSDEKELSNEMNMTSEPKGTELRFPGAKK